MAPIVATAMRANSIAYSAIEAPCSSFQRVLISSISSSPYWRCFIVQRVVLPSPTATSVPKPFPAHPLVRRRVTARLPSRMRSAMRRTVRRLATRGAERPAPCAAARHGEVRAAATVYERVLKLTLPATRCGNLEKPARRASAVLLGPTESATPPRRLVGWHRAASHNEADAKLDMEGTLAVRCARAAQGLPWHGERSVPFDGGRQRDRDREDDLLRSGSEPWQKESFRHQARTWRAFPATSPTCC